MKEKLTIKDIRKKQMDASQQINDIRDEKEELKEKNLLLNNIEYILDNRDIDEELRAETKAEVETYRTENSEKLAELKSRLETINQDVMEDLAGIEENIHTYEDVNNKIDKVEQVGKIGKDIESVVLPVLTLKKPEASVCYTSGKALIGKLKEGIKNKTNDSIREWKYRRDRYETFSEKIQNMKEELKNMKF